MKQRLLILMISALPSFCFSQDKAKLDSLIYTLNRYMSAHIPDMNSGVSGYINKLDDKILEKTTLVFSDQPHKKTFDLEDAKVRVKKLEVDRESAKVYGFRYYYEISINDSWFSSNIEEQNVARRIERILNEIITELNK